METSEVNFEEICRCCKGKFSNMVFIFGESIAEAEFPRIDEMIMAYTSVVVHRNDGLPAHMCMQCVDRLKIGYAIRRDLEQADNDLRICLRAKQANTDTEMMNGIYHDFFDSELQEHAPAGDIKAPAVGKTSPPLESNVEDNLHIEVHVQDDGDVQTVDTTKQDEGGTFRCLICSTNYISSNSLQRHMSRYHGANTLYRCKLCMKSFKRQHHIKRHLYTHLKEKAFTCELCKRSFSCLEQLKSHATLCTGKRILACNVCNKGFVNETSYELHRKMHEEVEPPIKSELTINDLNHYQRYYDVLDGLGSGDGTDDDEDDNEDGIFDELNDINWSASKKPRARRKKSQRVTRRRRRPLKIVIKDEHEDNLSDGNMEVPSSEENSGSGSKTTIEASEIKLEDVSEDENGPFPCPICSKEFPRIVELEAHGRDFHKDSYVLKCPDCVKTFARVYTLRRHQLTHQTAGDKKTTGDAASIENNRSVDKKLSRINTKNPARFKCKKCLKCFSSQSYLKVHMQRHVDNGERNYVCPKCNKPFLSKSNYTEHMKFHSEKAKKFLCSECGLRFVRNDYLIIHMRRHRGEKPFKCKFCGKGFPRDTDLKVHERYHTGEKTHLCTTCGRGFGRAYNLTVHMRTHTGEKPYKCTYCESAFAQCNDLKAHLRRHTGERFHCDLCSETFLMGYALTQHKRNVHGLNIVSNIRRLKSKMEIDPDDPPETVTLPQPVLASSTAT